MAGLCWMAAALVLFLSAGDGLAAVDQNWLTSIIEGIKNEYELGDTFSLAVNVPQNQDINNLQQVFQNDPADKVKQKVSGGQVYQGARVVAAAQSEALSRVLENVQPFIKSSQGNFLVIYSEESPCGPTCTTNANTDGIASKINDITQNWSGYAFVFSKVFDVPDVDATKLSESFKLLGVSKLGLDNIFRCYKPGDDPFQCTSCSSGGDVTPSCVADNAPSNEEQGVGEETGAGTGTETAPGEEMGAGIGTETAPGEEMGAGIGTEIAPGIGGGTGGDGGKGKSGKLSRCKGRHGRQRGCKRRGGRRRGKGGKVQRQCKRRGGCKGRRGHRGGKVRKGRKQKRGRKVRGGKGRGRGKPRGGRRGRGKKGGRSRRGGKRRGGGSKRKSRGRRKWGLQ
ncbi:uncharacterized protein LOC131971001 [Centropristis striata]|uniref:uncharacterized protein LOC131971001 n=1 Tax=Centropristis striata TaxID=184440 RepID=UPI0027E08D65|nr:uncharacterized protein LOC131971001 [Centropristis striata]